jgi:hypothetical protein
METFPNCLASDIVLLDFLTTKHFMRDAIPTICRAEAAMRTFAIRVYQLLTKDDIRNFNASDIASTLLIPTTSSPLK